MSEAERLIREAMHADLAALRARAFAAESKVENERARFERETARMFRAAQLATQSGQWCPIQEAKKFTEAVWS